MTPKQVYADVKNIKLNEKFDASKYKSEIEDEYYDYFDVQQKSASGRDVTVRYYYNDDWTRITCDDYEVMFTNPGSSYKYGAEGITITVKKTSGGPLDEELKCWYTNGESDVQVAYWFDDEGYHSLETWFDEEGKIQSYDNLIFERLDSEPETNGEILTDEDITVMPQFIMGRHNLSYFGDADHQKWFLTADFVLTFDSEDEVEAFREKYSLKTSVPQGDESENPTLRTGELTLPIAENCEDFGYLMVFEINDSYYLAVTVNEKGEIDSVSPGFYSLY
ncbi:MAG: hypothetical protein IKT24_06175 [Clostridia bacterium]|nr:hypothetical protein [Clostridia bacterium]